ncbi:hypothetical protein GCM10025857_06370 [Alicyclobacillus contaminans]|uniref:restriction endonuclease subunit S n=1 Tax=Alicyclobacillus contaminans TaxID=392016 RepID=UPI00047D45C2|nr:restriction endonuclease subunit S [Alicyclobacillus contaminans]GMA49280.1 hypothetical protein GCM10025857_06370 [Alicyclobacillus contaminans]
MMKLGDLFDVRYGNSLELNRMKQCGSEGIPFISRKSTDNGIAAYVEPVEGIEPNPAGELTVALSGNGVLSTFVQERPYYTAFHVACLRPKVELSKQELLYYCLCIKANRYRYNYGRQANRSLREIILPSPEEIPSWVHEFDINMYDDADAPANPKDSLTFDTSTWNWFRIDELFEVKKGKRLTKAQMTKGFTPYLGAISKNNGISDWIGQEPIHSGNTISVNYDGSVGEAFYQPEPFWCSDAVNVLYPKFELNPFIAMFLITVIKLEKYRFNYGRKWHVERMKSSMIKLPVIEDGTPDWGFMERYIKTLPFSSQIS